MSRSRARLAEPAPAPAAGSLFLGEIREQPDALLSLLEHAPEYARVAEEIAARAATTIRMVGHGSSDNAASYGVYAFGLLPGWTALRDSISLTVYYGAKLDLSSSTVLGLSQSGRTPDVVEYVRRARAAGAFTVAVTNDPGSELASISEAVLPLGAGDEHAVAATKTYLNQVAALGLPRRPRCRRGRSFRRRPPRRRRTLRSLYRRARGADHDRRGAVRVSPGRMFVIGRGVEFATAVRSH